MRIGMVAPVWVRVPPELYGGIELVAHLLTEELVQMGEDVTLFASGDSVTNAKLKWLYPEAVGFSELSQSFPLTHVASAYKQADDFDVIHNNAGVAGIAMANLIKTPVLTTLHNNYFIRQNKPFFEQNKDSQFYNAISESQRSGIPGLNYVKTVYNAIEVAEYPLQEKKGDYLLSLGNLWAVKGADIAIDVAKRLGLKLIIAGKLDPAGVDFFNEKVKPQIDDKQIFYEGQVTTQRKYELFANAKAFVFPIRWEEPFGLVMVEAMACGTPVVAFGRGSVPEVVADGKTGYVVNTPGEMVEAVKKVDKISPRACREHVEAEFSPQKMARDYLADYQEIVRKTS